ncbi:MAG: hypothetical protein ACOC1F_14120, partial [Myxococcota bacterium]
MTETKSESLASLARTIAADLATIPTEASFSNARDSIKIMRLANYAAYQTLEGSVFPAIDAALDMQQVGWSSVLALVRGETELRGFARQSADRV